ncbi:hypothetical protein [uncultured Sphingomonas sp.]|uniref:hypothetical protein n=1 Tax=uncultured Sphingomonas sp. TaxID=158754 RepID=UPI0035C9C8CE
MSRTTLSHVLLLASLLVAIVFCGGLLVYGAGRGADLTDEVFYLVWARDPGAYALIYQPFGYLLHPLFALVRGDLRSYRLIGFAITAVAGALLGLSLSAGRRDALPFAAYGMLASLTIFFPWIITPSYNSAANVGAALAIAGILTALSDRPGCRTAGSVLTAIGLCLAAFSKPPLFAIAVAVIVVVGIAAGSRRTSLALIVALVLAGALISLFLSPAAIPGLIARMAASQHVLALPNTPLSLPIKVARDWLIVPASLTGAAVAAGASLLSGRFRRLRWLGYAAIALSLLYVAGIAADAVDGEIPDFIGLALVTAAAGYAGVRWRYCRGKRLAIALLLAAPFAVALGTFNNQWAQLNFSMVFPLLAIFVLASGDPLWWRGGLARALAIVAPGAVMLLAACHPYSLPASIFEQQVAISHPVTHGAILVDPETAAFVRSAHGLAGGALLVDLSGTGPGVAAALGARAPVLAWLNPAVGTWPDVVWSRLAEGARERAWFVGPVWPLFGRSAPARWLVAHRARYCGTTLPEMPFWGKEQVLQVWRPCRHGPG